MAVFLFVAIVFAGCVGSDPLEAPDDSSDGAAPKAPIVYGATWESINTHPVAKWYDDAKFGIFIHWGLFSVPAWAPVEPNRLLMDLQQDDPYLMGLNYAEWYMQWLHTPGTPTWEHHLFTYGANFNYDDFIPMFTAENYDPEEWVSLIEGAGARYFVYTTKHCDGFAMWPTETNQRNSIDLGPHRDIVGELVSAARNSSNLKVGFYYSLLEWLNPAYTGVQIFYPTISHAGLGPRNPYTQQPILYTGADPEDDYVKDHINAQLVELIDTYSPDDIWIDAGWDQDASYWNACDMIAYYYNEAEKKGQDVVIGDRWSLQDFVLGRIGVDTHGDYNTPEYAKESTIKPYKWETCEGIGRSFGYNSAETEREYKNASRLVDDLADIVSKNGNLLLNIGPDGTGAIPKIMQDVLLGIGAWLNVNGEAIYGTRPYVTAEDGPTVRYTKNGSALYAISLEWPGETLTLTNTTASPGTTIRMLGVDRDLEWTQDADGLHIKCPDKSEAKCDYAYAFRISND